MVYCVALIGNIASGKSTVAQCFNQLGIQTLNADYSAKRLTAVGSEAYREIVNHFGTRILLENNELNRKKLRTLIFANPLERQWLENLLHPKIREALNQEIVQCFSPYCIVEIPLLKDKLHYPFLRRTLLVTSTIESQIARIIKRDQCTKEEALAILKAQPSIEERIALADDILINDDGREELEQKIKCLHLFYLLHP